MQAIKIKPLSEMALTELFDAHGRIIWAQSQCEVGFGKQFDIHAQAAEAIRAEVERREDRQRHGAIFAPRPAAVKDEYGEDVYA